MHLTSLLLWLLLLAGANAAVENQQTVYTTVTSYTTTTMTTTIFATGANSTSPSYTAPASYTPGGQPTVTSTLPGSTSYAPSTGAGSSSLYTPPGGNAGVQTSPPVETNPAGTTAIQAGAVSYREGGMATALLVGTLGVIVAALL